MAPQTVTLRIVTFASRAVCIFVELKTEQFVDISVLINRIALDLLMLCFKWDRFLDVHGAYLMSADVNRCFCFVWRYIRDHSWIIPVLVHDQRSYAELIRLTLWENFWTLLWDFWVTTPPLFNKNFVALYVLTSQSHCVNFFSYSQFLLSYVW